MTKLRLSKLRQAIRALANRRGILEGIIQQHHPMIAASLIARRFRPGAPAAYYLSIPTPGTTSRHRYVRQAELEPIRRQTAAWRQCSTAIAAWVRLNHQMERLLRRIGKGRCRRSETLFKDRRKRR